MCTRILKKESSSRALAFVVLLIMMPLGFIGNAQSCGAAEDTEHQPLLRRNDVAIPINGDGGDLEEGGDNYLGRELPKRETVSAELKQKPNSESALAAMNDIQRALYYADVVDIGDEGEIENIFREEKSKGVCSDKGNLGETLIQRARDGADEKGPLQQYFRDNKTQILGLIDIVQQLEKREEELRNIALAERQESRRILGEYECLKTTRTILAVCIPVAFVVAGVGAWGLTWYLGGK